MNAFEAKQLTSLCLNFGETRQISRGLLQPDVQKCADLLSPHGGVLPTSVGEYEFRFIQGDGHTIMALKRNRISLALAGLAMNALGAEIMCDELVKLHSRMLYALKRPIDPGLADCRPASIPWLGICLDPTFVDTASFVEVHQALTTIWAAAFAIAEQGERKCLTSHACKCK